MTSNSSNPQRQTRSAGSKSKWFHNIDGPTAESMLMQHGMDGSFLARPSASTAGDYTLSVRRDNQVTHVKIQSNGEFFDLYGGDKFATLQELVEHYMNNRGTIKETNGRMIELRHALINEDNNLELPDHRGMYTPWYHPHISGTIAEQLLRDKGKQGSFLVRSSTNQANALVLCVLVEQQVLHIRIYYERGDGYDVGGGQKFESLSELVEFYRRTPMVDKSGTVVHLKQPFNATRMTANQMSERIQQLKKGGFWQEFEELQRETETSQGNERLEGSKPENKGKNRFKNILPFDKTRVKLDKDLPVQDGGGDWGDYINANYVKPEVSFTGCRNYIATQGPMTTTIADFWRMVWQENSRIIVMTTKEEERSKAKCARYWPSKQKQPVMEFTVPGGAIVVRHLEELVKQEYTLNKLEVQRQPGGEVRQVLHYQYLGWPDHNVPQDPKSVLSLLSDVADKAKMMESEQAAAGPVIVHCSAGIGRTGSVIVIDMLLAYIEAVNDLSCDIDVQKLTHHVRSQRSGMVQTEGQYRFVYEAVQTFIASKQQQQQQPQQPQQQQQQLANGHDYTNLPPLVNQQQQQQQQQQQRQQPTAAPRASTVGVPSPPPRQRQQPAT